MLVRVTSLVVEINRMLYMIYTVARDLKALEVK
jgi:hypothetical protein